MSLRDMALAAAAHVQARASVENPIYPLTSSRLVELLGGPATDSGEQVTPKRALTIIAAYRAVQIIAGSGAMVPLLAYRRQGRALIDETEKYPVLVDPHPEMTPFEWFEWLYASVELHGNAFFQKRRFVEGADMTLGADGLPPVRYLLPIRPELVRVGRTSDGLKVFEVTQSGEPSAADPTGTSPSGERVYALTTADILHIPGFAYDGVVGLSPIDLARQGIGSALAAEKYGAALFGRGALVSGLLQTDKRLPPGAADALRDRMQEMMGGMANAHRVAVLDQGAKYQPLQLNPEQAQFLETRKFSVIEMARLFGVPPHLLMETSAASNWGTGLEQQTRGFITFSLSYRFSRVAGRFTKELMPIGVVARHNTRELLQADTLVRFQAHAIAIKSGFENRAEARELEGTAQQDDPDELEEFVKPSGGGGGGGFGGGDGGGGDDAAPGAPAPEPGAPTGLSAEEVAILRQLIRDAVVQ